MTGLCVGWLAAGCGGSTSDGSSDETSSAEVAIEAVSGALNTTHGSTVALKALIGHQQRSLLARVARELDPLPSAWAATPWSCSGGNLSPKFGGPGSYTWTPPSCTVSLDGESGSSTWSSTFTLGFGDGCDATHESIDRQIGGCSLTRTTAAGGNTRTITTPDGTTRMVTHDTNGAATGWDASVSPAPSNAGVVVTCGASGCDASRTIAINGSHITGTITGSRSSRFDHTVSTGAAGLTATGAGTSRTVSGTVTVQHNLTKNTATVTFTGVTFGDAGCPFPTAGTVTAAFTNGPKKGTSETVTFTPDKCGEISVAGGTEVTATLAGPI